VPFNLSQSSLCYNVLACVLLFGPNVFQCASFLNTLAFAVHEETKFDIDEIWYNMMKFYFIPYAVKNKELGFGLVLP
jgi:hypothetical protein